MTGVQITAAALNTAVVLATVAFVAVVMVTLRRLGKWPAWPSRTLIALAVFNGVACLATLAVKPFLPAAVTGASWLALAVALVWTRWWLHRQMRRRITTLLSTLPKREGDLL